MRLSIGRRLGPWWLGVSFRPGRGRRTTTARYYLHEGCPVHHRRRDTAEACARRMQRGPNDARGY